MRYSLTEMTSQVGFPSIITENIPSTFLISTEGNRINQKEAGKSRYIIKLRRKSIFFEVIDHGF